MKNRIHGIKLLIAPVIALIFMSHHMYTRYPEVLFTIEVTGFILLVASSLGRIWASAFIAGKKNQELVTDGPFSIVRNPLYFFTFLGLIGAGLVFDSVLISVLFASIFLMTHWPTILREEQDLHRIFGKPYLEYTQSVPRFFPNPWKLSSPEQCTFIPSAFTRAVVESSLILGVFALSEIFEWVRVYSDAPYLFLVP